MQIKYPAVQHPHLSDLPSLVLTIVFAQSFDIVYHYCEINQQLKSKRSQPNLGYSPPLSLTTRKLGWRWLHKIVSSGVRNGTKMNKNDTINQTSFLII